MKNIIYGINPLIEAIRSNKNIDKIFFLKGNKQLSRSYKELIKFSKNKNKYIPVHIVSKQNFSFIKEKNHQGVFAIISPIRIFQIKNLLPVLCKKKNPIVIILDRITDVKNFGAIVRTSVCAGVDAVILPNKNTVKIGPDSIKTSSGALFHIPICKEKNIENTINLLIKYGFKIFSATEKSNLDWNNANFLGPIVLILGNEKNGIYTKYLKMSDYTIKIPSFKNNFLSLNVSVACGIILYEILRQRNFFP
ncbi:23S rRNA (guanosine(2251)-2'-O)-methyltransferase RlmB [Blattabacterium cuenoti]|uniref:23S rRNA (guanosine(2251)-2'-O)-methyltransferase RlmB n=1 Tax=Blattabacterium cuenoti TaxID=1653831 RepID=UPI00163BA59E|nr:23S rRNA (guanosine(2251)-2'-O)-methyltransferase RlmB [Blattabacterium cuenoti]